MTETPAHNPYATFQPKHRNLMWLAQHREVDNIMAAGGIRSGKSVTLTSIIIDRALDAPGSSHGVFHALGNVCDRNLLNYTFEQTFNILMPGYWDDVILKEKCINQTDRIITLPNKSRIYFIGLDDPNKVRGLEFCTVWVNEANLGITYDAITLLQGRLTQQATKRDGSPLQHKMLIDLNPTVKSSWEYQAFKLGKNPIDGSPLPNPKAWQHVIINAIDNAPNLPPGTLDRLFAGMSAAQRRRDELGEWSEDNPNALFSPGDIRRGKIDISELVEIVVAVDPAASSHKKSDHTGIVVAGRARDGQFYVLKDATLKGKPEQWAQRAVDLYHEYGADWIVAEKNCGGEMVENVLRRSTEGGRDVPIRLVHASRGKKIRAEPVQVLYTKGGGTDKDGREIGRVNHVDVFNDLEQQMIEFDAPGYKGSPDRVDALVWALTWLSGGARPVGSLSVRKLPGFMGG